MKVTAWRAMWVDGAILVGLYLVLVVETAFPLDVAELLAGFALITAAVLLGRRFPLAALVLAAAASGSLLFGLGGRVPLWPFLLMCVVCLQSGRRMARVRPALIGFGAVLLAGAPAAWLLRDEAASGWPAMAMGLLFAGMLPWQLGRHLRLRSELASTGWERAEQLEHEQRIVAEQARLRERTRIASDMHDSLGHELSLIALRAGALEVAPDLAEAHRAAAGELRASAAVATERLHAIIGVLRAESESAPLEPVDDTIDALVQRAAAAGMPVLLRAEAPEAPEAPEGQPPEMVRRAAYRIVQEALTNAAKHAAGAQVTVSLTYPDGAEPDAETVLRVHNTAAASGSTPDAVRGQRGLAGLRERVRLIGGSLSAGPDGEGFTVSARLPHAAAPGVHSAVTEAERSESARALHTARRRVRGSLISLVALPVGLFLGVLGISGVIYVIDWYGSTWHDERSFAELRLGTSYADVRPLLPTAQRELDSRVTDPPRPPGARCEYYSATQNLFDYTDNYFRLCFAGDRLVAKNVLRDPRELR